MIGGGSIGLRSTIYYGSENEEENHKNTITKPFSLKLHNLAFDGCWRKAK